MPASDDRPNYLPLIIIAALVIWWSNSGGDPVEPVNPDPPPVVELDPLAQSHLNDRSSKIRILRDMAAKMNAGEFQSDQQQADWWNDKIDQARRSDFRPFTDATAEAIVDDRVGALADTLEGK